MNDLLNLNRSCPKCSSTDYIFRSRKAIPPNDDTGQDQVETKYRCKACGNEWRERVVGKMQTRSRPE